MSSLISSSNGDDSENDHAAKITETDRQNKGEKSQKKISIVLWNKEQKGVWTTVVWHKLND